MKKMKRMLSLVLCLMMLAALVSTAVAEEAQPAATAEPACEETFDVTVEPEPEAEARMCVRFLCTPDTTEIEVYELTAKPSEEPVEPIAPEPDGSYLLLPGEYLYRAFAEGYESLEDGALFVESPEDGEDEMQIEVSLTADSVEAEAEEAMEPQDADPAETAEEPAAVLPEETLETSEAPVETPEALPETPEALPETPGALPETDMEAVQPAEPEAVQKTETARVQRPATAKTAHDDADDQPDTLDADEAAPDGFTVPAAQHAHRPDAELQKKAAAAGTELTFRLENDIVAVLKDGIMTVSGKGDVRGYNHAEDCPWYDVRSEIRSVVFAEGVEGIGPRLFWYCENLASIRLPQTATYVSSTFLGCTALKRVDIPASVTHIHSGAFCDCTALETVTAPGVTHIGEYAFQNTAIRTFTLPKTLTNLEPTAFWKGALESYAVEAGNTKYTAKDGVLYIDGGKTLAAYPTGRTKTSVTIPAGVETVKECAFASNPYIKKLNLNGVQKIEYSAFTSCTALESLTVPDSLMSMGSCAFENCTALKSVKFGSGLKKTGYRVFASCKALEKITFGTTLEEIGGLCFAYCSSLKSIKLPETIKKAENGCFGECTGLESFTTTALEVIPYQMLLNDVNLKTLRLNSGITEINRYAVYGCRSLEKVTVPESVTLIHDNAFDKRYTAVTVKNKELDPYGRYGWRRQEYITLTGLRNYEKAYEVQRLVNEARAAEGLDPLVMDAELTEYAMRRSAELAVLYAHTRPDSSAFYSMFEGSLYAENAAEYQVTPAEVMDAWMNSEGHRGNIMQAAYKTIGVGCFEADGRCYWVQWFAKGLTKTDAEQPANATVRQKIGYAVELFGDAPNTSEVIFWFTKAPEYSYALLADNNVCGMQAGEQKTVKVFLQSSRDDEKGGHVNAPVTYSADQLNWSVQDPSVATVQNGVVTAKANGKTTLMVSTRNGRYSLDIAISVGTLAGAAVTFADGEVEYRGTTPYVVANGKAQKPKVVVTESDGTVVDASRYTVTYRNNVKAGTAEVVVTAKDTGETCDAWFKIYLPATTEMTVQNGSCPVLTWKPVEGAKGYVIYRRAWNLQSKGWTTFERWNNTTETRFYDRKVYAGTRYQYGVKAYYDDPMDNYNLGVVGPLKTIVYITTREIQSVTPGKGKLTVKWSASKVFTGYQVQVATDSAFSKGVKTYRIADPKTHELTVGGLKSGKTCYVRVRSYQVFEGMTYYGAWSGAEKVKVR